ncbi:MAG: hypothetical protein ACRDNS_22060 [Trebonia sp.]
MTRRQSNSSGSQRRGYTASSPLVVHPPTFVPLPPEDEQRALAALAELLAPLFTDPGEPAAEVRPGERRA